MRINRPKVTITGKTYEVTNDSWATKYRRTFINRSLDLGVKKEASNFCKRFDKEAKKIEEGNIPPYLIMQRFVDNKLFTAIKKVDQSEMDF